MEESKAIADMDLLLMSDDDDNGMFVRALEGTADHRAIASETMPHLARTCQPFALQPAADFMPPLPFGHRCGLQLVALCTLFLLYQK